MRTSLVCLLISLSLACNRNKGDDRDGDGFPSDVDCDDEVGGINPDAVEICDGIDNDCDDEIDEGVAGTWYVDADGDSFGNPDISSTDCDQPEGYVDNAEDCNDASEAYGPGAEEFCNDPADYNCDGSVGFEDIDGDGVAACEDCDDANVDVSPETPEVCDGIDNDCDGDVDVDTDPTLASTWFFDGDQDGFGDTRYAINSCNPPFGYVNNEDDCDDASASAFPGGTEVCDELDNDCDGEIDGSDAVGAFEIYEDSDADGYGIDETVALSCSLPAGYAEAGGDCLDSDEAVNPGEAEICNDAVDNDCDGAFTGCEVDATLADLVLEGEADQDYAGVSLDAGGDLDGDGNADLVVGASRNNAVTATEGAAYVFFGPLSSSGSPASLADADLKLLGSSSGDEAGEWVSIIGDYDDDGLSDLVVTASLSSAWQTRAGAVYLLLGSTLAAEAGTSASLSTLADQTIYGSAAFNWLGGGLSPAGDVDGDGNDDFLAGATGNDTGSSNAGAVYLFTGSDTIASATGTAAGADGSWYGEAAADYVGSVLGGPGDLDGDGNAEILVGLITGNASGGGAGIVYVISGEDAAGSNSLSDATARVLGDASNDRAGTAVAAAGDMNGDGLNDFWIGASRSDLGGADAGAAFLVLGRADLSTLDEQTLNSLAAATILGEDTGDGLGSSLAGARDFDLDGTNDLLAGVRLAGLNGEGTAYLFSSPASGTLSAATDAHAVVQGDDNNDHLGSAVAFGGDLFGSGGPTMLIGAWEDDAAGTDAGAAYLFESIGQ